MVVEISCDVWRDVDGAVAPVAYRPGIIARVAFQRRQVVLRTDEPQPHVHVYAKGGESAGLKRAIQYTIREST